jgi:hypothetical protein
MNEQDLRDCFAMFALMRISFGDEHENYTPGAERCYKIADAMMEARKPKEDVGIASVKRIRKTK